MYISPISHSYLLLLFGSIVLFIPLATSELNDQRSRATPPLSHADFVLSPERVDVLLHAAAMYTLLQAKAKQLLLSPSMPQTEKVVYEHCSREATSVSKLARCVVALLSVRDDMLGRMRTANQHPLARPPKAAFPSEEDWITQFRRMLSQPIQQQPIPPKPIAKLVAPWRPNGPIQPAEVLPVTSSNSERNSTSPPSRGRILKLHESIRKKMPIGDEISRVEKGRKRRARSVWIKPMEGWKQLFKPNTYQRQRKLRRLRTPQQGWSSVAAKSAIRKGRTEPNIPWFMEPLNQLLDHLKSWMLGELAESVGPVARRTHKHSGKRRQRREAACNLANLSNVEKLRKIQQYYTMVSYCNSYFHEVTESNARFLDSFSGDHAVTAYGTHHTEPNNLANKFETHLREFASTNLPILSPTILSLFPASEAGNGGNIGVLSPNLLSFHEEGPFSMPTLFKLVSADEKEMHELLELLIQLSGADKILDKLLKEVEPKSEDLQQNLHPTIGKLREWEKRFEAMHNDLSSAQQAKLDEFGYAYLTREQLDALYGAGSSAAHSMKDDLHRPVVQNERRLEEEIRQMAKLEHEPGINASTTTTLSPQHLLYLNRMRDPVVVNQVILSPRAFATTLLNPSFLSLSVLSPQAFVPFVLSPRAVLAIILSPLAFTANILTPQTILTDILSPRFFHSNILSPRAISSLILSPRFMLGEVLSPKLMEVKILNPNTFFISILGPNILSPRVLSPMNLGIFVLNPNILSPTFSSKGNYTVQILSPNILSDDINLLNITSRNG